MLKTNHNEVSKQFMQKILMFIDTVFINASNANSEDSNKILTSGMLNIRDAIFSDIVRDNQILQIQNAISQEEIKKKEEEKEQKEENLNQETK